MPATWRCIDVNATLYKCLVPTGLFQALYTLIVLVIINPSAEYQTVYTAVCKRGFAKELLNRYGKRYVSIIKLLADNSREKPSLISPAGTWRLYNVVSTSMQRHDVAWTLRRRCIDVMCPLGHLKTKTKKTRITCRLNPFWFSVLLLLTEESLERCGAVVKRRTRDREVPGSIPTNCKCCFLEQETLSTLLSTGFYPGKKRATWKISTRLLNVLPSINKVDYYYYYYYY